MSPSSIGSVHGSNVVANGENLPADLFALVADKRPAHGLKTLRFMPAEGLMILHL